MTTSEMYRLLELEEGASPEAVKKAYFRLIRKYPPETNPQEFQQLRAAYEVLREGPPKESGEDWSSWATWKTPVVGYLIEVADKCMQEEHYDKACKTLEDALVIEPDNVLLHLLMARYQYQAEHPQVAARYAEFVTEKLPNNKEGWSLVAMGCEERGWHKKARKAFQRAYELGEKDPVVLLTRIKNLEENGEGAKCADLYREYIQSVPLKKEERNLLIEAFCGWAETLSPDSDTVALYLSEYERMIRRIGSEKNQSFEWLTPLIALTENRENIILNPQIKEAIRQTLSLLTEKLCLPEELVQSYWDNALAGAVHTDSRLEHFGWKYLCMDEMSVEDPELLLYVRADSQLCLLRDLEQAREEAKVIRRDYPELAERFPDLMNALESGNTDRLFRKLKRTFDRLSKYYTGGHFTSDSAGDSDSSPRMRWATPQMVRPGEIGLNGIRTDDGLFADEPVNHEETPYPVEELFVRDQPKVGRNDPCPCGSGKKFKKCCMGKGIYD